MVNLDSGSAAEDAAFTALQDAIAAAEGRDSVIIGGLMVSILEATQPEFQIGRKHTKDADLGLHRREADVSIVRERLENRAGGAYTRTAGHLFRRDGVADGEPPVIVDVLVAGYTSRLRKNVEVGGVVTIEVPGLADALNYRTIHPVELTWSDGSKATLDVPVPKLHVALALKLFAWRERKAGKDAVDVFRCARLCTEAGLRPDCWANLDDTKQMAMQVARRGFSATTSDGIVAMGDYLNLSEDNVQLYSAQIRGRLSMVLGI